MQSLMGRRAEFWFEVMVHAMHLMAKNPMMREVLNEVDGEGKTVYRLVELRCRPAKVGILI